MVKKKETEGFRTAGLYKGSQDFLNTLYAAYLNVPKLVRYAIAADLFKTVIRIQILVKDAYTEEDLDKRTQYINEIIYLLENVEIYITSTTKLQGLKYATEGRLLHALVELKTQAAKWKKYCKERVEKKKQE